ncbi:hypothetical protein B5S30_g2319 [[Candida] boidinii]|nr:hypothetical protein B5S30_g2319 [[Candida] boidinii]
MSKRRVLGKSVPVLANSNNNTSEPVGNSTSGSNGNGGVNNIPGGGKNGNGHSNPRRIQRSNIITGSTSSLSSLTDDNLSHNSSPMPSSLGSSLEDNNNNSSNSNNVLSFNSSIHIPSVGKHRTTGVSGIGISSDNGTDDDDDTLKCPICNERMISLLQLNRHLDDEHTINENLMSNESDFKNWFKKKVVDRATDVFKNNKLDILDSGNVLFSDSAVSDSNMSGSERSKRVVSSVNNKNNNQMQNLQDSLPKSHWKRPYLGLTCHLKTCDKPLNNRNGMVNCRKCGELYCNEHTYYRVRINKQLEYDPYGIWCRCCENCYLNKPGMNLTIGESNDYSFKFKQMRESKLQKDQFNSMILEKRLIKLIEFINNLENSKIKLSHSILFNFEKQLISWQDDNDVTNCRICHDRFQFLLLKKHHCRLCGLVICGNLETGCSMEVPINLLIELVNISKENNDQDQGHESSAVPSSSGFDSMFNEEIKNLSREINSLPKLSQEPYKDITVRICLDCKNQLFKKKLFYKDLNSDKPESLMIYSKLNILKIKILKLLPEFESTMLQLNNIESIKELNGIIDHEEKINKLSEINSIIQDAITKRIKLVGLFSRFEKLIKSVNNTILLNESRIKNDKELIVSKDEFKVLKSIYQINIYFLQENMSKLRTVPKLLKNKDVFGGSSGVMNRGTYGGSPAQGSASPVDPGQTNGGQITRTTLSDLTAGAPAAPGSKPAAPTAHIPAPPAQMTAQIGVAAPLTKREIREQREKLMVLMEQRFLVEEMTASAKRQRNFEDFAVLDASLADLAAEIAAITAALGDENAF